MKKFLVLLIIFIFPVIVTLIATEILLRNIPNEYSIKKEYLDANSNNIEILVLGNSHTYRGVNPAYIKGEVYNAAFFSQSLDYDFAILNKYNGDWDNLRSIILPISYGSLYTNLDSGIESWRAKNYNIYFDLSKGEEWKYLTETFSSPLKSNIFRINDYYFRNLDISPVTELGWYHKGEDNLPQLLVENGKQAAERHTKKSNSLLKSNLDQLQNILSLAKQNKWKILFVTTPTFHTYWEHLSQNQMNNTIEIISKLSLQNDFVKYYNFIDSPEFTKEDFDDADHLNGKGAAKFSEILNNLIQIDFN